MDGPDPYKKETSLLARIAWMYYIQGMTHEEIARKLRYSRPKVTRLLAKARQAGVVEISINPRFRACFDSEEIFRKRFDLKDVVIVPSGRNAEETRDGVGRAAAQLLEEILDEGDVLGIGWGRNLHSLGRNLRAQPYQDLTVVQMMGGLDLGGKINLQGILEMIATKVNGRSVWVNSPAIVNSPEIRQLLLSDEGIARAIEIGTMSTVAFVGVGDVTPDASLVATNALGVHEIEDLARHGAVGDILAWFFDIEGRLVRDVIFERVIAVPMDAFTRIPRRVAVTSGPDKAGAIVGALRGRFINSLVTDEQTAEQALSILERDPR